MHDRAICDKKRLSRKLPVWYESSSAPMKKVTYKGHTIELASEKLRTGGWVARATVVIAEVAKVKRIPIFGRRRATFDSRKDADAYALELARLWVEGRIWGGNGRQ